MNNNGIISTIDTIFRWITRIAILNIQWFLFSLLGLIGFGVFPSTTAALSLCREWMNGNQDIPTWKTFIKFYKKEFWSSNLLGWILSLIGTIFFINYKVISTNDTWIVTVFAFYLMVFFYVIVVIWSFPLLVLYKNRVFEHIKNAFIIGIAKIHYSATIIIMLFAILYFSLEFPGVIPFFTLGIAFLCWYWLAFRVFRDVNIVTRN